MEGLFQNRIEHRAKAEYLERLSMQKDDIEALMRAHKHRAHSVAFLHILRQARLDPDDCAFLFEHVSELESVDLIRFHSQCPPSLRSPILDELARRAQMDPQSFQYELLDPLRATMNEREWVELSDRLSGKVPPDLWERVLKRSHPDSSPPLSQHNFLLHDSNEIVDLSALDLFEDDDGLFGPENKVPEIDIKLEQALAMAESAEAAPTSLQRAKFAGLKDQLRMSQLVKLHKSAPRFLSENSLQTVAIERARRMDENWSEEVVVFPQNLRSAVLERLRHTQHSPERIMLLEWLEKTGTARKDALRLAVSSLRSHDIPQPLIAWFARQLHSHNAWKTAGKALLDIFIERRAYSEMIELATLSFNPPPGDGSAPMQSNQHPIIESLVGAYSSAFVTVARGSLERGNAQNALAALSALGCIDLQPKLLRPIRLLKYISNAPDVLALIQYLERKSQNQTAKTPSLENVVAAVHAFSDAAPED